MTIRVSLGRRSYPILITDSYRQLPRALAHLKLPRQGWVVSHRRLLQRYGPSLLGPLRRAGWTLETLSIPETESSKSFSTLTERELSKFQFTVDRILGHTRSAAVTAQQISSPQNLFGIITEEPDLRTLL